MGAVKAYIFDLDGTLLNSMGIWEQIDRAFLKKRGLVSTPDYIRQISSMSFPEAAKYTIDLFGLKDSPDDLMNEWNEMTVHAYGNTIPLKPGAREYLLKVKATGAKIALATSATRILCNVALAHHGIAELFDVICFTEEVDFGKSRPDIFLLATEKLNVRCEDCIVFDDVLAAIMSAKSIGMTTCGVYDESSKSDFEQIAQLADAVVYDWNVL
ncbi:HAD family phosphatase [Lachnospiraceae bacterium ZAX-1]